MRVRKEVRADDVDVDWLTFGDVKAGEVFETIRSARVKTACGGYVHLDTGRFVSKDDHSFVDSCPVSLYVGEFVVTEVRTQKRGRR